MRKGVVPRKGWERNGTERGWGERKEKEKEDERWDRVPERPGADAAEVAAPAAGLWHHPLGDPPDKIHQWV